MDTSTNKLRSFVAVAEDLHFTRAAARLFIAQQALSKQIRDLEEQLGTELFKRNTRSVELTPAGYAFLAASREALASFDGGVTAAQRAGQGTRDTLSVGFFVKAALELTTPILNEFRARHPEVLVALREFSLDDPSAGLIDGSVDLAFIRLPVSARGIRTEKLFTEPRVVALAVNHPLADRANVTVDDLLQETLAIGVCPDGVWRDFWTLANYRDAPPPRLIETTSHSEEMELVATGQACSITAASAARYTPQAGVKFVPIEKLEPVSCALAWREDADSPLIESFVGVAREVRDREKALVRTIEHPRLVSRARATRSKSAN